MRRSVVVPLVMTCASVAVSTAVAGEARKKPAPEQKVAKPRERGIRGALLGEDAAPQELRATAPVVSACVAPEDPLAKTESFLAKRRAKRIEDLSVADLRATVRVAPDEKDQAWRVRLGELAREELGRRHVTYDPFPAPAMPEPTAPRPPMVLPPGGLEILARIVKGETWPDSPHEGEIAVASVVLNRVRHSSFPKTIAGVAHQPWQFSCYNEDVRPELYWGPIRQSALDAAQKAADGADPVRGATHYFNPYLVKPDWAKKLKFVRRIGTTARDTHDFYK